MDSAAAASPPRYGGRRPDSACFTGRMEAGTGRATSDFWENDYNAGVALPARPSDSFAPERTLAAALRELAPVGPGDTVVEVGCAPARWLVWYAEQFGANVTGIEYTPGGAALSRRNLEAAGVDGRIVQGDFFSAEVLDEQFDLVTSFGFIEHFEDLEGAFRRHVDFTKPGGRVALGVPNFRGIVGWLQKIGDRAFLDMHNLRAMDPELYRGFAPGAGVEMEAHRYLDPLDGKMIRVSHHGPGAITGPMGWIRSRPWADRFNHPKLSSYLLMTFRRPG